MSNVESGLHRIDLAASDLNGDVETATDTAAHQGSSVEEPDLDLSKAYDELEEDHPSDILPGAGHSPVVDDSTRMPSSWGDAVPLWDSLSKELKAKVISRENSFHKGIEQYRSGYQQWNDLHQTLQPYLSGQDPSTLASTLPALFQANAILSRGSQEQKTALIQGLMQTYGVSLDQASEGEDYDPAITELRQRYDSELGRIAPRLQSIEQYLHRVEHDKHSREIEKFAKDSENKYFPRVVKSMTRLFRSGEATDIADAYNKAIWLDPDIRAELIIQQQESPKKAAAFALKQAQTANIRGGKPAPLSQRAKKTPLELLSDRYDELSRSSD